MGFYLPELEEQERKLNSTNEVQFQVKKGYFKNPAFVRLISKYAKIIFDFKGACFLFVLFVCFCLSGRLH